MTDIEQKTPDIEQKTPDIEQKTPDIELGDICFLCRGQFNMYHNVCPTGTCNIKCCSGCKQQSLRWTNDNSCPGCRTTNYNSIDEPNYIDSDSDQTSDYFKCIYSNYVICNILLLPSIIPVFLCGINKIKNCETTFYDIITIFIIISLVSFVTNLICIDERYNNSNDPYNKYRKGFGVIGILFAFPLIILIVMNTKTSLLVGTFLVILYVWLNFTWIIFFKG